MNGVEGAEILAAGVLGGAISIIVGSGSLITFPLLLALGYSPVVANVSSTVGMVPGTISGVIGYRKELAGQRPRIVHLGRLAALGGLVGGVVLLAAPASAFGRVVPYLILLSSLLMAVQPRLTRFVATRRQVAREDPRPLTVGIFLTSIYGGYFGAAQAVILFALLAVFLDDDLQRLNGLKNTLVLFVNGTAAVLFVVAAPVDYQVAGLLALGSIAGGQVGARVGRRLSARALRLAVVSVGILVAARLITA